MATAKEFMLDFVTKYTKENYERLNNRNKAVDEDIFNSFKKIWWTLDWILADILIKEDFKRLGYVVLNEMDEKNIWTVIYKLGDIYIKQTCPKGEAQKTPFKFEFVKLIETTVVVKTYEPLKPHEFPKVAEVSN